MSYSFQPPSLLIIYNKWYYKSLWKRIYYSYCFFIPFSFVYLYDLKLFSGLFHWSLLCGYICSWGGRIQSSTGAAPKCTCKSGVMDSYSLFFNQTKSLILFCVITFDLYWVLRSNSVYIIKLKRKLNFFKNCLLLHTFLFQYFDSLFLGVYYFCNA